MITIGNVKSNIIHSIDSKSVICESLLFNIQVICARIYVADNRKEVRQITESKECIVTGFFTRKPRKKAIIENAKTGRCSATVRI